MDLIRIEINQNWDFESGVDCGFKISKLEGLLCKISSRRGIGRSRPLDLSWTVGIRSSTREKLDRTAIDDVKGAR